MAKSYLQIQAQIAALNKQAESIRKREVQGVIKQIKEAIAVYGLTALDLGLVAGAAPAAAPRQPKTKSQAAARPRAAKAPAAAKQPATRKASLKKGSPAAPVKFSDGAGNDWSGRGPRPQWFKDALAAGQKAQDLRV
jgi:DNA-binding protein H-NS